MHIFFNKIKTSYHQLYYSTIITVNILNILFQIFFFSVERFFPFIMVGLFLVSFKHSCYLERLGRWWKERMMTVLLMVNRTAWSIVERNLTKGGILK